ncbi:hypothetical protein [Flavobacterium soyae]|uniref:hypothetical protein n=1 Tax=Flavobacterium soyae TaxID=2903098 RepID=UPI001E54E260|nr:hypothetical protein [Flavobacterium soyae]MCD9574054.1 hypothetical protein [Flavobacterium soyae]
MKKIQCLLIILFLFMSFNEINNYSIWGRLVDHGFSPVPTFTIKVFQEKDNVFVKELQFNDKNGEFIINDLPPNKYILEITVEQYTKYSITKEIINKNESVGEICLQNIW